MKNKQIEALEKLIAVKDETIKELEKQIQLLKNQPPVMVPQFPEIPQTPINPWSQPITPQQPWSQPWYGPCVITSANLTNTNDPNTAYIIANSDGNTTTFNISDIPRC